MARFGSDEIGDPYTIKWLRPVMVTAVASKPLGKVLAQLSPVPDSISGTPPPAAGNDQPPNARKPHGNRSVQLLYRQTTGAVCQAAPENLHLCMKRR